MKCEKVIITIDGPAGSGKSTVGKILSRRFKIRHVSSGKIYRAIAFLEMRVGLKEALKLVDKIEIGEDGEVIFDRKNIDEELLSEEVGKRASDISKFPEVRDKANEIQRRIVYGSSGWFVVDGRDEGTEVFPEAQIKIFLEASPEERARRKFLEQKEKSYDEILKMIKQRDEQDRSREVSPLRIPKDAIYIDSTGMSIEDVINVILDEVRKRMPEISRYVSEDSK